MGGVAIVVFCDLVDSTAVLARLGDDRMETVRRRHVADVSDAVEVDMQLANAAFEIGDHGAVPHLRAMLEPLRGLVLQAVPMTMFGQLPEWHIGRLELTAGRPVAAVEELRRAVARADAIELCSMQSWARVDLAVALQRSGDATAARTTLAEAEALAERSGMAPIAQRAATARAELEGRPPLQLRVERRDQRVGDPPQALGQQDRPTPLRHERMVALCRVGQEAP